MKADDSSTQKEEQMKPMRNKIEANVTDLDWLAKCTPPQSCQVHQVQPDEHAKLARMAPKLGKQFSSPRLDLVELPPNLTANRLSLLDPHIGNLSHLKKLSHCENLAVVPSLSPKRRLLSQGNSQYRSLTLFMQELVLWDNQLKRHFLCPLVPPSISSLHSFPYLLKQQFDDVVSLCRSDFAEVLDVYERGDGLY
ncbi:hypothetical protein JHK86_012395 [Glycine max]|nr:hypothetical protein JHK86_012395 [Glycine max]